MASDDVYGDIDATGICGQARTNFTGPLRHLEQNQMFFWSWQGRSPSAAPKVYLWYFSNSSENLTQPFFPSIRPFHLYSMVLKTTTKSVSSCVTLEMW